MKINKGLQFVIITVFTFTTILFTSCGENKLDIDISNIKLKLEVKRLDKDLLANYPNSPDVELLKTKYGNFFDLYNQAVIAVGSADNENYKNLIIQFNEYCVTNKLNEKTDSIFADFDKLVYELINSFKRFKYYFPAKQTPNIYTYLSAFNQSVVSDENIIGIGLDKYLGSNCVFYKQLGWDKYKVRRMTKEMIPVDCMRALAIMEFPYKDSVDNLLNQIVYEGKIQYFLDAMLPTISDTLKHAYTNSQMEWANYNEDKMWAYIVDNELLFSNDQLLIRKFIGDAPFTAVFHNNSAPRAGAFLGWKIVHKYMDENENISLKQLMENADYQGILNSASYRP